MSLPPHNRAGLLAVVLLTAATHFTYLACSSDYFFPDSGTYTVPAKTLSEGGGFGEDEETPETMRTPGYPLLLAAFYRVTPSPLPVVVSQHLLACLLTAALYFITLRETGNRRIAFLAAFIVSIDLLTVHYANKVLTESVFTAVLVAVILLALGLARRPSVAAFAAVGVMSGALTMIRPVAIGYPAVLLLFFILAGCRHAAPPAAMLRGLLAFVVAALLIPLGWALRNQRETGVLTVASIAGTNMLLYRAAGVLAITDPGPFAETLPRRQDELERQTRDAIRRAEGVDPDELPHAVLAAWYSRAARPILFSHPLAYALLSARGAAHILFETDWDALALVSRLPPAVIHAALLAGTFALFLLAVAGLVPLRERNWNLAILILLTCAYFVAISAGAEAEARFRAPLVPLFAVAAAAGIDALLIRKRGWWQSRRTHSPLAGAGPKRGAVRATHRVS